jgi:hypothetical protein
MATEVAGAEVAGAEGECWRPRDPSWDTSATRCRCVTCKVPTCRTRRSRCMSPCPDRRSRTGLRPAWSMLLLHRSPHCRPHPRRGSQKCSYRNRQRRARQRPPGFRSSHWPHRPKRSLHSARYRSWRLRTHRAYRVSRDHQWRSYRCRLNNLRTMRRATRNEGFGAWVVLRRAGPRPRRRVCTRPVLTPCTSAEENVINATRRCVPYIARHVAAAAKYRRA